MHIISIAQALITILDGNTAEKEVTDFIALRNRLHRYDVRVMKVTNLKAKDHSTQVQRGHY